MRVRATLVVVALHAAIAACSGTETGNPGTARVAFGLRASDPALVSVGSDGSGNRVEALLLAVDQAALIGCDARSGATPLFEEPVVVDLVRGTDVVIPAGEYCGIRVTLAPRHLPAVVEAPAIEEATVAAHGVRADGVPFTIASRTPLSIVAEDGPFEVQDGDDLVLAFDVSVWLNGGVLEGAVVVDGRATIDGTGNSAAQFDQQVAAGLFRDRDGDGAIEPDETIPLAAVGPAGPRP